MESHQFVRRSRTISADPVRPARTQRTDVAVMSVVRPGREISQWPLPSQRRLGVSTAVAMNVERRSTRFVAVVWGVD